MFLNCGEKKTCFGCEACVQICNQKAILMKEDSEGFRYPVINIPLCIDCGRCKKVCPYDNMPIKHESNKYVFGGYHLNSKTRFDSTSGGAFSAIVDSFCDQNYVIFGAEANGLFVFHSYITDKNSISKFQKSKYSQSIMGLSYRQTEQFLKEGKKVLFSGTPCQIAGLLSFLGNINKENLLMVEVICEGIPSPLYIRKLNQHIEKKYGVPIESIDYRYTGNSLLSYRKSNTQIAKLFAWRKGKWDFETMRITLMNEKKVILKDRWFNPFWSIWLDHLMSRPSCYHCPFTTTGRVADISLGDLWGVHKYCPELYGNNGGASLVICNTEKGKKVFQTAEKKMFGHELKFEDALQYQGPMRRPITMNPSREHFFADLKSNADYRMINKKWAKKPTIKLLFQKYLWGNRQKVFFWNITHKSTP